MLLVGLIIATGLVLFYLWREAEDEETARKTIVVAVATITFFVFYGLFIYVPLAEWCNANTNPDSMLEMLRSLILLNLGPFVFFGGIAAYISEESLEEDLEKMVGSVTGFLTGCFVYLFGGWGEPGMVVTPDGGIITTTIDWSGTTDGFFRALFLWLGVPKSQVFDAVITYTPWILSLCVLIFGGATAFLALVERRT
jgi:hypothetical protein